MCVDSSFVQIVQLCEALLHWCKVMHQPNEDFMNMQANYVKINLLHYMCKFYPYLIAPFSTQMFFHCFLNFLYASMRVLALEVIKQITAEAGIQLSKGISKTSLRALLTSF